MASLFKQAAKGKNVESQIPRNLLIPVSSRGHGARNYMFQTEQSVVSIAENYMAPSEIKKIFTLADAEKAALSLETSPVKKNAQGKVVQKGGKILKRDLANLMRGAEETGGYKKFVKYLYDYAVAPKVKEINSHAVTLRSGKTIKGLKVSSRTYLIVTPKGQVAARSFATGRFVPIPRRNKVVMSL